MTYELSRYVATDTTDITLGVKPYYMYHDSRGHLLTYEALWYKTWPMFKLWLAENCHNHDMGVKPTDKAVREEWRKHHNTFGKQSSDENVQTITKMFG